MHNGACSCHNHGHGWPRWPRLAKVAMGGHGSVPGSPSPIFFCAIFACAKKVKKVRGSLGIRLVIMYGGNDY